MRIVRIRRISLNSYSHQGNYDIFIAKFNSSLRVNEQTNRILNFDNAYDEYITIVDHFNKKKLHFMEAKKFVDLVLRPPAAGFFVCGMMGRFEMNGLINI